MPTLPRWLLKHLPILIILIIALAVRLYRVDNPILDWHSFRQADTASVTRMYVQNGINLLVPRYHDHSNIASGLDNQEGYRMVEFPIVNAFTAVLVQLIPFSSVDIVSRVVSIFFSLGTITAVGWLVTQISGKRIGFVVMVILSLFPYYIYYSRVVLPEPAMLFFSSSSLALFYAWLSQKKMWQYLLSLCALALALLLKPFVLFTAPIYLALSIVVAGKHFWKNWQLYLYPVVAVLPMIWWRDWITQYPSGIPASSWLFNGNGIRFRPAWFRWIFFERLIKLQLGYAGAVLAVASLIKLSQKELLVYGSWWLGMLAYVSVIATGNVQHDYYQVLLVPIVAITVARGFVALQNYLLVTAPRIIAITVPFILLAVGFTMSWSQVSGYFNVNHWEYVEAGRAADMLTPPDAKIIAPAFGDTMFLYQTNRSGWPIGFEIDKKIEKGATHYITTSYDDEARELEERFFTIQKTPEYLLLDLTKPKP